MSMRTLRWRLVHTVSLSKHRRTKKFFFLSGIFYFYIIRISVIFFLTESSGSSTSSFSLEPFKFCHARDLNSCPSKNKLLYQRASFPVEMIWISAIFSTVSILDTQLDMGRGCGWSQKGTIQVGTLRCGVTTYKICFKVSRVYNVPDYPYDRAWSENVTKSLLPHFLKFYMLC